MQITLNKKTQEKVKKASKRLGLDERQFVNLSILKYLAEFKEVLGLKKELEIWDILSASSLRKNNF
jgi:hypothetical protein